MPIDFPATPSPGDTYQFAGRSYVYDGEKWEALSGGAALSVGVSPTVLGESDAQGALEALESSSFYTPEMFAGDADAAAAAAFAAGVPLMLKTGGDAFLDIDVQASGATNAERGAFLASVFDWHQTCYVQGTSKLRIRLSQGKHTVELAYDLRGVGPILYLQGAGSNTTTTVTTATSGSYGPFVQTCTIGTAAALPSYATIDYPLGFRNFVGDGDFESLQGGALLISKLTAPDRFTCRVAFRKNELVWANATTINTDTHATSPDPRALNRSEIVVPQSALVITAIPGTKEAAINIEEGARLTLTNIGIAMDPVCILGSSANRSQVFCRDTASHLDLFDGVVLVGSGGYFNPRSATYSVTSNVVTVALTAHGYSVKDWVYLDYTSGTAPDSVGHVLTVPNANSFTFAQITANTSGNATVYTQSLGTVIRGFGGCGMELNRSMVGGGINGGNAMWLQSGAEAAGQRMCMGCTHEPIVLAGTNSHASINAGVYGGGLDGLATVNGGCINAQNSRILKCVSGVDPNVGSIYLDSGTEISGCTTGIDWVSGGQVYGDPTLTGNTADSKAPANTLLDGGWWAPSNSIGAITGRPRTNTVSHDFGTVPANDQRVVNVSIPGMSLAGNVWSVVVTQNTAVPDGLVITGRVHTDDLVRIFCHNPTGGAIAAGNRTYRVLVYHVDI